MSLQAHVKDQETLTRPWSRFRRCLQHCGSNPEVLGAKIVGVERVWFSIREGRAELSEGITQ